MKKVRFKVGAFFLALLAMLMGMSLLSPPTAQTAEQKAVMLNLTQPIEANKTSTASARFAELTQEAMKYGMADASISGQVEYSMQPDRTIRSSIRWTAVSIENGGKKVTEGLESSLSSKFRVPESSPRAEPGTKLKAVGDVEALATALGKLKAQLDAQNVVVQKEEKSTKTQSQAVSPTVSAQDQSNQGKYLSDVGSPFNTVVEAGTTTTYSVCDTFFVDIASKKAVKQYKPVYTKGGVQTGEGVCAPNYAEFVPITSKAGKCTYRYDFQNATAVQQEQLFYMNGSTEVLVGDCRDASVTYPLFESRTGCSVTMDLANKKAFPTSKLAFDVGSVQMNATECRSVSGTTGIDLVEEACDPMWEHDFINNVSYLVTRLYYTDDKTGEKIYASTCGRSSTVSFPHVQDTTNCTWIMDDEKQLAYQQGKSIIKTGTLAGDVVVRECHTIATVNYTYIGTETTNKKFTANATFTFPANATNFSALVVGPGQQGNYSYGSQTAPDVCIVTAGNGGKAGEYKVASLQNPSKGEVVTISFVPNKENTIQFRGVTNRALVGTGGAGTATAYGDPNLMCENQWGKAKTEPGQSGYTALGRFGLNDSSDLPFASPTLYGFGFGGTGHCQGGGTCPYGIGSVKFPDPGVVILEYSTSKYMRPDGTLYQP